MKEANVELREVVAELRKDQADCCVAKREPTLAERLQTARPFVALGFSGKALYGLLGDGDMADEALDIGRRTIQEQAERDASFNGFHAVLPINGVDLVIVRVEAIRRIFPVVARPAPAVALNETELPLLNRG